MPLRLSKHRVLLDGIPLNESQSTSLPSAATLDIWSVSGNIVPISGSATISGFTPAPQAGTRRILLCTGTPSFTHSTNLLLPGSADYIATAGDRIEVLAVTTTQFRLSIIKASVLPDVQFAKDGSGNVTGLKNPGGGVHATLGTNVLTVGAGGKYATIQAAIDYIATQPAFTLVASSMTVTAWSINSDIATTTGTFPGSFGSSEYWVTHPALSGRLYPVDTSRASNAIVLGMRRIEASFSGSEALSLYIANTFTILLLNDSFNESITIANPMNVRISSVGKARWQGYIAKGAGFTHGSITLQDLRLAQTSMFGSASPALWNVANTVRVKIVSCTTYGINDSMFSPSGQLGSLQLIDIDSYQTPGVPLGHYILVDTRGDIVLNRINIKVDGQNTIISDFRVIDQSTARNIILDGANLTVYDSNGQMNKVAIVAQTLSSTLVTGSSITYISPVASTTQLLIAADDIDGSQNGAGSCAISGCNINASPLHTGEKHAWRSDKVGSTNMVVIQDCPNLNAVRPSAGTLTRKDARGSTAVAYAATVTPDANIAEVHNIGTLTGNLTVAAPTNPQTGQRLTLNYAQNATGSWAITYNAVFKATAPAVGSANQKGSHSFVYDGTNWVQSGGALVWL